MSTNKRVRVPSIDQQQRWVNQFRNYLHVESLEEFIDAPSEIEWENFFRMIEALEEAKVNLHETLSLEEVKESMSELSINVDRKRKIN